MGFLTKRAFLVFLYHTHSNFMRRIGLISDTHSHFHPEIPNIFEACDEIWHAGDFGHIRVAHALMALKPLRGVYGNIDGQEIRQQFPRFLRFQCEHVDVLITHIGGYPGNYAPGVKEMLRIKAPDLFISGHSHILKVIKDKKFGVLHMNPGAAGRTGLHKVITMLRFTIDQKRIKDLDIVEFSR